MFLNPILYQNADIQIRLRYSTREHFNKPYKASRALMQALDPCRNTLRKKVQLGTLFVPYLEPSGERVPKRVLYMFKNLERFRI